MTWTYAYTPSAWPSFVTLLLLAALAVYSWRRRSVPGALPFAISCLLALPIAAARLIMYLAIAPEAKIFWYRFEILWWLPVITAITCFILEYAWPGRWLTRRNLALLSITPLLFVVYSLTANLFQWPPPVFNVGQSVTAEYGLPGFLFFGYSSLLLMVNLGVFSWLFISSPHHRWPVVIMAFSQILTRVVFLVETPEINALLLHIPHFAITYTAYAVALFGFGIFDPIPLARQAALEQLTTGILVLDKQGQVASLNPAAERMLHITAQKARGQAVRRLLSSYPEESAPKCNEQEIEFSQGAGQTQRFYTLVISRLQDWRGLEVGQLLLLRDVTEQKLAQKTMLEQQRALAMLHEREQLARELHDSLGQVFAFVSTQGQAARRMLDHGDTTTADAYIARLVDVAHEADIDIRESIFGLRATLSELRLFPVLERYLTQYERHYGIHIIYERPAPFWDRFFDPLVEVQLLRILQEALTNVRKHSGARSVQIQFALSEGHPDAPLARITVQDDGCGFDASMRLDDKDTNVGLGVMRERAREVGGRVELQSKPGQGTKIVVFMPVNNAAQVTEKGEENALTAG